MKSVLGHSLAQIVETHRSSVGLTWFFLVFTGLMRRIVRWTPKFLVRGIQLALGIMLAWQGLKMMQPEPWLGLVAIAIVLLLRESRHAPRYLVRWWKRRGMLPCACSRPRGVLQGV